MGWDGKKGFSGLYGFERWMYEISITRSQMILLVLTVNGCWEFRNGVLLLGAKDGSNQEVSKG